MNITKELGKNRFCLKQKRWKKAKEDFVFTFTREVREQQAALFAKVAKIEDQINRLFNSGESHTTTLGLFGSLRPGSLTYHLLTRE